MDHNGRSLQPSTSRSQQLSAPSPSSSTTTTSSSPDLTMKNQMKAKLTQRMLSYIDSQAENMMAEMRNQVEIMMCSIVSIWKGDMAEYVSQSFEESWTECAQQRQQEQMNFNISSSAGIGDGDGDLHPAASVNTHHLKRSFSSSNSTLPREQDEDQPQRKRHWPLQENVPDAIKVEESLLEVGSRENVPMFNLNEDEIKPPLTGNANAVEEQFEDVISDCDCDSCMAEQFALAGYGNDDDLLPAEGKMENLQGEEYYIKNEVACSPAKQHQLHVHHRGQQSKTPPPQLKTSEQPPPFQGILLTKAIRCIEHNCKVYCPNKAALDEHVTTVHKVPPYQCYLRGCGERFESSRELDFHTTHIHATVTNWQCSRCAKPHDASFKLYQHYLHGHYPRLYSCATQGCSYSATDRRQMYQHYNQVHRSTFDGTNRKYTCSYEGCGRQFTEATYLRTHRRIHLGIKPYRCCWPHCEGYSSEERANVIRHIRVRHLRLPATFKEQQEKGIRNDIDPKQWLVVDNGLLIG